MVHEALKTIEELLPALDRARARREPGHVASLRAFDAMKSAVVATRDYLQDEMLHIDGSRGSARYSSVVKLWQEATRVVAALDLSGPEKALLRGEGWHKPERWKRLEKQGGLQLLQGIVAHCEWLLESLNGIRPAS